MNGLLWNLLLAFVWAFAAGELSPANFVAGFIVGFAVLAILRNVSGAHSYVTHFWRLGRFVLFFIWQLLISNVRVAYDILTPQHYMKPGIIAVPLDARSELEILLLANLLTLTPGSLSIDLSDDRKVLYVHLVYMGDPDRARESIKKEFERLLLEAVR